MGFRDCDIDLDPGEFIVVPMGVEHRPEALDEDCHVVLLEPNTTLNTGNIENEHTVRDLDRSRDSAWEHVLERRPARPYAARYG